MPAFAASARSPSLADKWALPVRQARSLATRERILEAAEQCFAESGYENAKVSDIAKAAGCSVGAIYFRFPDKHALFLAIAESFIAQTREGLSQFLDAPAKHGPADLIRSFVLKTAASFRQHRGLFRAIVERGFEHPDVMKPMMAFRESVIGALSRALLGQNKKKSAQIECVRVIAQMVFGFLLTGVLNPRAPTRIDDKKAVSGLADAAIAYFERVGR